MEQISLTDSDGFANGVFLFDLATRVQFKATGKIGTIVDGKGDRTGSGGSSAMATYSVLVEDKECVDAIQAELVRV